MFRFRVTQFTAGLLVPLLLGNDAAVAAKHPPDPMKMKDKIALRGVGHGVRVTFADRKEVNGIIASVSDNEFSVRPKGGAEAQAFSYSDVTGVHDARWSTKKKVLVGSLIFVGAVGVTVGIGVALIKGPGGSCDPKTAPLCCPNDPNC